METSNKAKSITTNKFVILIQRNYSQNMSKLPTTLAIPGGMLRNALINIYRGAADFELTESEKSEVGALLSLRVCDKQRKADRFHIKMDPNFLFWARPELELLLAHYRNTDDKRGAFEITAALQCIDSEFKETLSMLPTLLPHSITFQYLWALLPPDSLVLGKNRLGFDSIWTVRSISYAEVRDVMCLIMRAEYIEWDGDRTGLVAQRLLIPVFKGIVQIEDLPYIPLKFHPGRDHVITRILDRSARTVEFWKPGFRYQEYRGTGLAEMRDKIQSYPVSYLSLPRSRRSGSNISFLVCRKSCHRPKDAPTGSAGQLTSP